MITLSVDSNDPLKVKPRVRTDRWINPRVSIRAMGPAFCEAWRLRIDGNGMIELYFQQLTKDLLLLKFFVEGGSISVLVKDKSFFH